MKQGFSLVELSIVLVILGLLTGGILSGQSLITAAEQRSLVTQITTYSSSVISFRDKYFAIPGDMNNATKFWGAADGTTGLTAACLTATAAGTCNGNGDGQINVHSYSKESFRFWQQMALAGLIEGTYTGVTGPLDPDDVVAGGNVPTTRIATSSVVCVVSPNFTGLGAFYPGNYGRVVYRIGADANASNLNGDSVIVTNEMAWNIDNKMDDGKPGAGRVTTFKNSYRPNCASSDDPAAAEYQLTVTGKACVLNIPSGI